jgi:hypothetical protein
MGGVYGEGMEEKLSMWRWISLLLNKVFKQELIHHNFPRHHASMTIHPLQ